LKIQKREMFDNDDYEKQCSLSLLGKKITVKYDNEVITGDVYYFSEKAIIVRRENEMFFVNAEKYEKLHI
jgi:hypothetical protein